MDYDLIIFTGAPGSGKSTIGEILREKEGFVLIDFGWLQQGHLNDKWSNQSLEKERMAFENLIFIINNYFRYGYKNIMVMDLLDDNALKLAKIFSKKKVLIISLIVEDNELKRRVLIPERDSGFRNVDLALKYNKRLKHRKLLKNELRIDNSHNYPDDAVKEILHYLKNTK